MIDPHDLTDSSTRPPVPFEGQPQRLQARDIARYKLRDAIQTWARSASLHNAERLIQQVEELLDLAYPPAPPAPPAPDAGPSLGALLRARLDAEAAP